MSDEVKILHIHKADDKHDNFIEFMFIQSGKSHILRESGFIKRYGSKLIELFMHTM